MGCCNNINITSVYNVVGIKLNSILFDGTDSKSIYCEDSEFVVDISEDDPGPKYRRFAHPPQLSTEGYWRSKCDFNNTLLVKDNIKFLVGAANNYDTTADCNPDNSCVNDIGFDYYLEMYINDKIASGFPKHYINNKTPFYGTDAPSPSLGCGCTTSENRFSINWSDYKLKTGDKIEVYAVPSGEYSYPAFLAVAEDIPDEYKLPVDFNLGAPYAIPYTPCGTSLQFINGTLSKTLVDTWVWPNIDGGKYDLYQGNLVGSIDCFLDSDIDLVLPNVSPPPKKYKIKISFDYIGTSAFLPGYNNPSPFNPFRCGVPIDPPTSAVPISENEINTIMNAVSTIKENVLSYTYEDNIEVNQNKPFFYRTYISSTYPKFIYNDPVLKTDQNFKLSIFYMFEHFLNLESESDKIPSSELTEGLCYKGNLKDYGYSYKMNTSIALGNNVSLFSPVGCSYHINGSFISKHNFRCQENIEPLSSILNFNVGIRYPQNTLVNFQPIPSLVTVGVNIAFKPNVEIEEINE